MPTDTLNLFDDFLDAEAEGLHTLATDTIKVALLATANAPDSVNHAEYADLTSPVSLINLVSDTIPSQTSSQTGGTYKLVLGDLTLTASGGAVGPFQYIVIYNDSATNKNLIGWLDYGSAITLADGETLALDFSAVNGVLQKVEA